MGKAYLALEGHHGAGTSSQTGVVGFATRCERDGWLILCVVRSCLDQSLTSSSSVDASGFTTRLVQLSLFPPPLPDSLTPTHQGA